MKLLGSKSNFSSFRNGSIVTIGNFDGVHLGHQALLNKLREKADKFGLPLVVILFEPQPNEYFNKVLPVARITSLREKLIVLKNCKVDYVLRLKFNKHLAEMDATYFAEHYFFALLHARYILVGADFQFGKNRSGDTALLEQIAQKFNATVAIFSDFKIRNLRVSSTKIREALKNNSLTNAAELLGRQFSLYGRVVHGEKRGRQWGIPTANLTMHRLTLPLAGVFFVLVRSKNQKNYLHAVANLGKRPTVNGTKNILEIHILDFNEDLYGEMLEVVFLEKLRDEQRFSSIDELIKQIRQDINEAKNYFKHTFNELTEKR